MSPTFRIGRIAGVEIGANWSWVIVFGLICWSLGTAVFPVQNPGLGSGSYAAMALAASLLFFASLLLHELGHAMVARREGMEIEGITLWLFGGVARFRGEFPSAGAEFRIAIAGPCVTAILGIGFLALAVAGHLPVAVDGVAAWLGYINAFLLAFNLLPALPLDGGRVLRASLWAARRDFGWATSVAAAVAEAVAVVMMVFGLLIFVSGRGLGGLWIAFLGWFLLAAAASESRQTAVREALDGIKVRNVMIHDPVTVDPRATLGEFVRSTAGAAHFTAYPVVLGGEVVGVLPLARALACPPEEWERTLVAERMLALGEIPVLDEDEDAIDGLSDLGAGDLHRGLVAAGGRITGFVSITDITRLLSGPTAGAA